MKSTNANAIEGKGKARGGEERMRGIEHNNKQCNRHPPTPLFGSNVPEELNRFKQTKTQNTQ